MLYVLFSAIIVALGYIFSYYKNITRINTLLNKTGDPNNRFYKDRFPPLKDVLQAAIFGSLMGCLIWIIAIEFSATQDIVPHTIVTKPLVKVDSRYFCPLSDSVFISSDNTKQLERISINDLSKNQIEFYTTTGPAKIVYKEYRAGTNIWWYSGTFNCRWDFRVYLPVQESNNTVRLVN